MADLLHELENNENILLMYLADELPAEDRAEVESMLRTDASLQRELLRLKETLGLVDSTLAQMDATSPLPQKSMVLGRLSRLMAQWQLATPPARDNRPTKPEFSIRHANWWLVALGATAATVLIATSLTFLVSDDQAKPPQVAEDPTLVQPAPNSAVALENLYYAEDQVAALRMAEPGGF